MKCPKCSFQLAPLVRWPADGGPAQNVLGCMNCGWATLIDEGQLKMMQEGMKEPVEATICDKQWEIMCRFMRTLLRLKEVHAPELIETLTKELAAIHVRSSHTPQPNVSGVSEGSNPTSNDSTNSTQLDLEQGS